MVGTHNWCLGRLTQILRQGPGDSRSHGWRALRLRETLGAEGSPGVNLRKLHKGMRTSRIPSSVPRGPMARTLTAALTDPARYTPSQALRERKQILVTNTLKRKKDFMAGSKN